MAHRLRVKVAPDPKMAIKAARLVAAEDSAAGFLVLVAKCQLGQASAAVLVVGVLEVVLAGEVG